MKRTAPKRVSAKKEENDDALDFLARDDSDDESSSNSSEATQVNGLHRDLSGDEDEEDWEDVDLSHKRHISLADLNNITETPDLEVTLERTQQSMRIKYSPPKFGFLMLGIKLPAGRNGKLECKLIFFIFNVFYFTVLSEMHGYGIRNCR